MKIENRLQRFSCISFLLKPPWFESNCTVHTVKCTVQISTHNTAQSFGRILFHDVNTDEIRYVLVNIYNANTEVEQVQVLSKLSKVMKNIYA